MKTRKIIKIYMKLMIKSPILFLSYLTLFIIISLYLMLTTKITKVDTYLALIQMQNDKPYILFDRELSVNSEKIYAYIDKNSEMHEIHVQAASQDSVKNLYEVSYNNITDNFFIENNGKEIKVDIPQGQMTLFMKIFLEGGKS